MTGKTTVPENLTSALKEAGITEVFGPGTKTTDIISYIQAHTPTQ